jgi:hypothetical protein
MLAGSEAGTDTTTTETTCYHPEKQHVQEQDQEHNPAQDKTQELSTSISRPDVS